MNARSDNYTFNRGEGVFASPPRGGLGGGGFCPLTFFSTKTHAPAPGGAPACVVKDTFWLTSVKTRKYVVNIFVTLRQFYSFLFGCVLVKLLFKVAVQHLEGVFHKLLS